RLGLGQLAGRVQVPGAIPVDEIAFALAAGEQGTLTLPAGEPRAPCAPRAFERRRARPERRGALVGRPRQTAVIVGLRRVATEDPPGALVVGVGVSDLLDNVLGGLSGQPERIELTVGAPSQVAVAAHAAFPG